MTLRDWLVFMVGVLGGIALVAPAVAMADSLIYRLAGRRWWFGW